jgi:hypothetical protein
MINEPGTGYWDYSNEIAPQWMDYGDPGAAPKPGAINVGGTTPPSTIGSGGMPVGGASPILTTGNPGAYSPISGPTAPQAPGSQFMPHPFMPAGMTFQPHTQFGQQASAPLNLGQQGRTYGQMPGGPNMAQQLPAFQSVRPGGASGFMPQFYNPYGPQPQQQPQQYNAMGQQPTQISQQPLQQAGLPALMREYRPGDNLVMSSNGVRIP